MRIIPKTAKVKVEFFKNISIVDVIIGLIGIILEVLLFLTNLGPVGKAVLMILTLCFFIWLYLPFDGQRFYMMFVNLTRYVFSAKKYSTDYKSANTGIDNFIPFQDVEDAYIVYEDYYAGVLQIDPREFRLLTGYRQDQIIDEHFGKIIRSINGTTRASIIKIDRKLLLDDYIKGEEEKQKQVEKLFELNNITQEELTARTKIIQDRIQIYERMSGENVITKPFYYLVVYDANKKAIDEILNHGISTLLEAGMTSKILRGKELAIFLKYTYTDQFEESDIDKLSPEEIMPWVKPSEIRFTTNAAYIDGVETFNYTVRNFPLTVLNAWGYQMFNIDGTKVVMNIEPYEKRKAIKMLDRSIQELASQSEQSFKASSLLDKKTHIETLVDVLRMLQNDNETLFKVTLHFTIYNKEGKAKEEKRDLKKTIKRILAEQGFELVDNFCKQNKAIISTNVSRYDNMEEFSRAIHSGSVSAVFPFVLSTVMDESGTIVGSSGDFPVIVDFFKRDHERVNSNMVILGKSGSGKSYATKTILTGLAAENTKIFILDPENEYKALANNLGGRLIDVGTATEGRINPFHVITTLDADEDGEES